MNGHVNQCITGCAQGVAELHMWIACILTYNRLTVVSQSPPGSQNKRFFNKSKELHGLCWRHFMELTARSPTQPYQHVENCTRQQQTEYIVPEKSNEFMKITSYLEQPYIYKFTSKNLIWMMKTISMHHSVHCTDTCETLRPDQLSWWGDFSAVLAFLVGNEISWPWNLLDGVGLH